MIDVDRLLEAMTKVKASDLHLKVGSPPMYRINGDLRPVDHPKLTPKDTEDIMLALTPTRRREMFETQGTADFAYALPSIGRFRVNIFHQRGSISLAIRHVAIEIPSLKELNLPDALGSIVEVHRGLVLVTGVTGSGKSTTLASMIDQINSSRHHHIVTIEDPIEFLHRDKKCIVNQTELFHDIIDFDVAMKHVLRQDPDVILLGEMRDKTTVKSALAATETGHLVFSTLHTPDAKQTLNRILHFFNADEERLILSQLGLNMRAVISQRLLHTADGKGRTPACEILVNTPIVSKLMREGQIAELKQAIQNGEEGMQTFNQALVKLARAGTVTVEEALQYADDQAAFLRNVKGVFSDGDRRSLVGNF
jgi:twitching motility protein PilT